MPAPIHANTSSPGIARGAVRPRDRRDRAKARRDISKDDWYKFEEQIVDPVLHPYSPGAGRRRRLLPGRHGRYQAELDRSFAGADMKTYARGPELLDVERMHSDHGLLVVNLLYGMFNHDLTSRKHAPKVAREALKKSDIEMLDLASDGLLGVQAL